MNALGIGLDFASGEELINEGLGGISGGCFECLFVGVGGDWVGVVCEEISKVKSEWRGFVDNYRSEKCKRRVASELGQRVISTYNLFVIVESATDAAPFTFTSIAPPLILSAKCECVGESAWSATPPSISVSDILACGFVILDWWL